MKKPIILIIEDNAITRKMLKITLETTKLYTIFEAKNGADGLQLAKNHKPDLILQDLILGDMDGFELNKQLRALPDIKDIPILALSGFLTNLDDQQHYPGFTTFLLKPIEPSKLLDIIKIHLPLATPAEASIGKGRTVLIADDNPLQLKLLSMQLQNVGYQIITATDGAVAFDIAKTNPPDAVISDILMPNLDGFGLCLAIRQEPKLKDVIVILLTAHYLEDADVELANKVGATKYMTRTPDEQILINALTHSLEETRPLSSDIPYKLELDIKEQHNRRLIRQLEQQVLSNSGLSKQFALQSAQLELLDGVAKSLTNIAKGFEDSLTDALYSCLDDAGVSKGVLYTKQADGEVKLQQIIGYKESDRKNLELFFGNNKFLKMALKNQESFSIPSKQFAKQEGEEFLKKANVQSALIVPLTSGSANSGVLFLGSESANLTGEKSLAFARTLGMQLGQSITLAETFENLINSEKRYRQLIEISPDTIFILHDEKFSFVNIAGIKLLGAKNPEQLIDKSVVDFFQPEYHLAIKEYISEKNAKKPKTFMEGKILTIDNKILDVEVISSTFTYRNVPSTYLIIRDITESKRSKLHLEVQYSIAWILAESATLHEATMRILKVICERLNWDMGLIWAVNQKENILQCISIWQTPDIHSVHFRDKFLKMTLAHGIGSPGKVWNNRKSHWDADLGKNPAMKAVATSMGLKVGVSFPIVYEDEVLGVIEFFNKNTQKVQEDLLSWFESIGHQFGLFLKRKHMEGQMLFLAEHDGLTGLSNRKFIEEYLSTSIARAKIQNKKLAVLFIDIDDFKFINDSMGHHIGDLLLIKVSKIIHSCLRPGDSIGRLGGDEFIAIVPNIDSGEDIIPIAERIHKQLENKIVLEKKDFFITISMGISIYPENGRGVQTLIKNADIAMYGAKVKGKNNFQFCTLEMASMAENRIILRDELYNALENNEFILYYQPKVDIKTQKTIGVEALIRWQKAEGVVMPSDFIYAIEEGDLIIPITEWVLNTACKQNKLWQQAGLPKIPVAVNVSVNNLNTQFLDIVKQTLHNNELESHYLEIELTESVLMKNVENNIQILNGLKDIGIKIAIDDFGTGYSSLSYLTKFPIHYLKIDQSFVRNIANDQASETIVVAIIAMAHSLGFKVIAEGVETQEQLFFLQKHGADEIQGHYLSKPLPAHDIVEFFKR